MEEPISVKDEIDNLAQAWMEVAKYATDIAYAKRVMYEAYMSEGFSEEESLELCKYI